MIILDTNVTSELMRARPDPAVTAWFAAQPPIELYSTVVTVAEISYGLERLPRGRRRRSLEQSFHSLFVGMADHVLPFDVEAALLYGPLVAARNGPDLRWTLWTHNCLHRSLSGRHDRDP